MMMYAILCYDHEADIATWTKEEDAAVIARLEAVQEKWKIAGRLGAVGRLLPTKEAKTVQKRDGMQLVVDGPFAETKEALLGFYVLECASMEDAVAAAKELASVKETQGSYEVRPFMMLRP